MSSAAETLGVTPGAITQRVQTLEATVGRSLLVRTPQGVRLTRAGQSLFDRLTGLFAEIESAYAESTGRGRRQRILLSTTPSFAATWLVPRLGGFHARHPGLDVTVEADPRVIDLASDPVDLAIRHGLGRYPGLESRWLMAPAQIVIGSPALLAAGPKIRRPEDCLRYPLLHDAGRQDWQFWLDALGRRARVPDTGPAYSDDTLLVRAAIDGQGLALVADTYAQDALAAGTLVRAFHGSWPTRFAYYLVGRAASFRRPAIARFAAWITAEAARVAA